MPKNQKPRRRWSAQSWICYQISGAFLGLLFAIQIWHLSCVKHTGLPLCRAMAASLARALYKVGRVFRYLGRAVKAAEPCCGIGGLRTWVEASGMPYESACAYDFDNDIEEFYLSLQKSGAPGLEAVFCGPEKGDVTKVEDDSLPDVELFLSGPPCQPYAPNGRGAGFADPRSEILEIAVRWIIHQAWRGSLVAFLLENSTALATHSYFWKLIDQIVCSCPFFRVEVIEQDLQVLMPHSRPRLWVRGLRLDCLDHPECPLPPPKPIEEVFEKKPRLADYLDSSLPNLDPVSLTDTMRANLALYKALAQEAMDKDGVTAEVMCIELDRNPLRQYGGALSFDAIPSLRTQGPKVFLVSLPDLKAPWQNQKFHRYLSTCERLKLQGHSESLKQHFRTDVAATKGAGNAFNVLQVACMVSPLLEAAVRSGALSREGVQKLSETQLSALIPSSGPLPTPSLQHEAADTVIQHKRKRMRC